MSPKTGGQRPFPLTLHFIDHVLCTEVTLNARSSHPLPFRPRIHVLRRSRTLREASDPVLLISTLPTTHPRRTRIEIFDIRSSWVPSPGTLVAFASLYLRNSQFCVYKPSSDRNTSSREGLTTDSTEFGEAQFLLRIRIRNTVYLYHPELFNKSTLKGASNFLSWNSVPVVRVHEAFLINRYSTDYSKYSNKYSPNVKWHSKRIFADTHQFPTKI